MYTHIYIHQTCEHKILLLVLEGSRAALVGITEYKGAPREYRAR